MREFVEKTESGEWVAAERVGRIVRGAASPCRVLGVYFVGNGSAGRGREGRTVRQVCILEEVPWREVPSWYALQTRPGKEVSAEVTLMRDGLNVLLPRLVFLDSRGAVGKRRPRGRPRERSPGTAQRVEPLFPGYLFVRLAAGWEHGWHRVRVNPWVLRVLGTGNEPVPVPDEAVELIMEKSQGSGIIVFRNGRPAWKDIKAGTRVEITAEPFRGLMGILETPTSGRKRVRVLLELLGQEVPVEVDAGSVRAVDDSG